MASPETTADQKLYALLQEVARHDAILRKARVKAAEAQAAIDTTINDYAAAKNRLDSYVASLWRELS